GHQRPDEAAHALAGGPGVRRRRLAGAVAAREHALRERRPHDLGDPLPFAEWDQLGLGRAHEHRVLRLAGDPPLDAGQRQRALDLLHRPFAEADVAGLAFLHDLAQRRHRLLRRRVAIEAVALVEVDVVGSQTLQRSVHLLVDLLFGEPFVGVRDREVDLRGEHIGGALAAGEHIAKQLLGGAASVHVGRVDEVDALVEGGLHARLRLLAGHAPGVRQPRAEADLGDLQITGAEATVVHGATLPFRAMATIDPELRIRRVRLAVAELDRSVDFYEQVLGLPLIERDEERALLGPDAADPALELVALPGAQPAPPRSTGLFHVAWLHPSRESLADTVRRIAASPWPFTGASDHGVSEALYLDDPDGLGIEVYADRPFEKWGRLPDGGYEIHRAAGRRGSPADLARGAGAAHRTRHHRRPRPPEGRRRGCGRTLLSRARLRAAGANPAGCLPGRRRLPPPRRAELVAERGRRACPGVPRAATGRLRAGERTGRRRAGCRRCRRGRPGRTGRGARARPGRRDAELRGERLDARRREPRELVLA